MQFEFLPPAQTELAEAVAHYNEEREGLGAEFAVEVYRAIRRIVGHPLAWTKITKRVRLCRTKRFPYGIIYQVRVEGILIVAVMHLRRRPGHCRDRLK